MFIFDGILLKPCLLQPCFHVAGNGIMIITIIHIIVVTMIIFIIVLCDNHNSDNRNSTSSDHS